MVNKSDNISFFKMIFSVVNSFRECFLNRNLCKKRALTTENTESTEVFLMVFLSALCDLCGKKPLRNSLLAGHIINRSNGYSGLSIW